MSKSKQLKFPESLWYGSGGLVHLWATLISPLTAFYATVIFLRRLAYRLNLLRMHHFGLPVIVVGNITVGGTGKTPMVIALVERLQRAGWKPAVVSRGYGGASDTYPLLVNEEVPISQCGDEPFLIARRTGCPVMVDPVRSRAVHMLEHHYDVDIVISDDGLQHYAMTRDVEVAVIDGSRRFGNGWLLPAGPLRELQNRLKKIDAVFVNGGNDDEASFQLEQVEAINLLDGSSLPLRAFTGDQGHALAGIGNPQKFFDQISKAGVKFKAHVFPDHYAYQNDDVYFDKAKWILMTEKDAVKCQSFATQKHWYIPVDARFNSLAESVLAGLMQKLETLRKLNG